MGKQYKTLMQRSGIRYAPTYSTTIDGAVRQAEKEGWIASAGDHSWTKKPDTASIYERNGEDWELVAVVSAKGVEAVDCVNRRSVKQAIADIEDRQRQIDNASDIMRQLNSIADKRNQS